MDDPKKSSYKRPPIPPEDEEQIIDLIDEVPESEEVLGLSDLENNLLEFERRFGAGSASRPAGDRTPEATLPDPDELEDLDFEEEDETPEPATASTPSTSEDESLANLEQHLDWLFAEDPPPPAAKAPSRKATKRDEVIEITEFEEQFLDAEEIPLEPVATHAPEPEEGETLELLDIEEDEPDDELIWFDTPATQASARTPAPGSKDATPALPTPAVELIPADAPSPPEAIDIAVSAAAAAAAPAPEHAAPAAPPADTLQPTIGLDSIPMDRIEAAVATIIERSYSGRIEAIILQAIEKAVTREIERLRNELLENEPGGRLF